MEKSENIGQRMLEMELSGKRTKGRPQDLCGCPKGGHGDSRRNSRGGGGLGEREADEPLKGRAERRRQRNSERLEELVR